MATIKYRIKGSSTTAGIKIRLRHSDKIDYELSTGLQIFRSHWRVKEQKVKDEAKYSITVNNHLNKLKAYVLQEFYNDLINEENISQDWLRTKVDQYFNKPSIKKDYHKYYFLSFIEYYIDNSRSLDNKITGKKLSERTVQSYFTTLNKIKEFERDVLKGKKLKIKDINYKFHTRFLKYLNTKYMLNPNTIGGYIDNIKLFCRRAELMGFQINPEVKTREFHSPKNISQAIYLNECEIQSIFNLKIDSNNKLDKARDWFIIGLWTGLRVSDLLNLNLKHIVNDYLQVVTFKTKSRILIPIHPQVKAVLTKYSWNLPPKLSDQKFNKYIKEICQLARINDVVEGSKMAPIKIDGKTKYRKVFGMYKKYELVSSHICRRSFATNHYGKIDTYTIMQITGHKSERQFLDYIQTTPTEHAEKLKKLWNEQ